MKISIAKSHKSKRQDFDMQDIGSVSGQEDRYSYDLPVIQQMCAEMET
jgi:hypothetical protein